MTEISRFLGIRIHMYYKEHGLAHFHAYYGEFRASIAIEDGSVLAGSLPRRALQHVNNWLDLHRESLLENWQRSISQVEFIKIDPLS